MVHEAASERGALADLYVAHAPDGIRLAFLLTGDRALAEDLVQDAFARLIGRLRHLRDPNAFGAYLRRAIVNLATSHFRHRRVERTYLERQAAAPTPATNANDALDETMHEVLLGLPQRQRAASSCASTRTSRTCRRRTCSAVPPGPSDRSSRAG
ncbi:MAG: sigma-70 family RNA polymerase sigma factor [Actinomycetota bacterium]